MKEENNAYSRVKQSLAKKSRSNREFFDHLILLIWCECKESQEFKSKSKEGWIDLQLPSYRSHIYGKNKLPYATARMMLSNEEQDVIQEFIDRHTFKDIPDAKNQMQVLFDDCQLSALNVVTSVSVCGEGAKRWR